MATMDVFNADPFAAISMTRAVDKVGYNPGYLGSIPGLIDPAPVRTQGIYIEERETGPRIIQTDRRGNPPRQRAPEGPRKVRSFETLRLSQSTTITAHQIAGIRAFGTESELQQVQQEVARDQGLMRADMELTFEHYRLGLVQGVTVDADGSTLYDWAAEFGQPIPGEVNFDLANPSPAPGILKKKCNDIVRTMTRALKGRGGNAVRIRAICGDNFWDDFTAHSEIRETYLYHSAAAQLREGDAWEEYRFGGITFANYRGTDDGTTVAVPTDKVKFFPVGAGIFRMAYSPAETFDFVNTLGQEVYSWLVHDRDRNAWVQPEMYSYPLPVCTMPAALHRGRRG